MGRGFLAGDLGKNHGGTTFSAISIEGNALSADRDAPSGGISVALRSTTS